MREKLFTCGPEFQHLVPRTSAHLKSKMILASQEYCVKNMHQNYIKNTGERLSCLAGKWRLKH